MNSKRPKLKKSGSHVYILTAIFLFSNWISVAYGQEKQQHDVSKVQYRYEVVQREVPRRLPNAFIATAFSGGGLRAAMLSYGALTALQDTSINPESRDDQLPAHDFGSPLLAEVDFVSAVSGGSLTASYWAVHGSSGDFSSFVEEFTSEGVLDPSVQLKFLGKLITPENFLKIVLSDYSRVNLLSDFFKEKFLGSITYEELLERILEHKDRPYLVVNATDMGTRSPFPFVQMQFDLICDDLSKFAVSDAVAASAAYPLMFPALVRKNLRVAEAEKSGSRICRQNASYESTVEEVRNYNQTQRIFQQNFLDSKNELADAKKKLATSIQKVKAQEENVEATISQLEVARIELVAAEESLETLIRQLQPKLDEEKRLTSEYRNALSDERNQLGVLKTRRLEGEKYINIYSVELNELQSMRTELNKQLVDIENSTWKVRMRWIENRVDEMKEWPFFKELATWFSANSDEDDREIESNDAQVVGDAESESGHVSIVLREFAEWTTLQTLISVQALLEMEEEKIRKPRSTEDAIPEGEVVQSDTENGVDFSNIEPKDHVENMIEEGGLFVDYINEFSGEVIEDEENRMHLVTITKFYDSIHRHLRDAAVYLEVPEMEEKEDDGDGKKKMDSMNLNIGNSSIKNLSDTRRVGGYVKSMGDVHHSAMERARILKLVLEHGQKLENASEVEEELKSVEEDIAELELKIEQAKEALASELEELDAELKKRQQITQDAEQAKDTLREEVAQLQREIRESNSSRMNRRRDVGEAIAKREIEEGKLEDRRQGVGKMEMEVSKGAELNRYAETSVDNFSALYEEHDRAVRNYVTQKTHYEDIESKFVHLIDGGAADNVGFTPLVELLQSFFVEKERKGDNPGPWQTKTEYVAVVSVDARAAAGYNPASLSKAADIFGRIGGTVDAAIDGTSFWLTREIERITERLVAKRVIRKGFLVEVNFDQIAHLHPDRNLSSCRRAFRKIPTSWKLDKKVVQALISMGRALVFESGDYLELVGTWNGRIPLGEDTVEDVCGEYEEMLVEEYKEKPPVGRLRADEGR